MTLTIKQSSEKDATDETVSHLVTLINAVYAEVECDMWKPDNTGRTYREEVEKFLKNNNLFLAEFDGKLVGSIKIEHIESSGRHLTAIINDILDMAKIEAGEYNVHIEPLNPVEVVDDVVKIISHRATNKSVEIKFTKPDIDLKMMADELRFRQILINILVNAVKFSPSNSVVKVDLKQTKDQIIILIKDYGVGMDQNEIKDAMRPFGTASNYHEDNINTGLGLPVSIEFAQLMNGNILLQSTKGAGTTVIVTLPAA